MKVEKKDLEKSQVELKVEFSLEEFTPFLKRGAEKISQEIKIDGFRSGKIPYDVLKQKIGEMAIYEEAVRIAINKTIGEVIEKNTNNQAIGQPKIEVTKLVPGNNVEYKIVLAMLLPIKLGEYKDLKIKKQEIKVEEKDVERTLVSLQESRASEVLVEREVKNNDKVLLDIKMFQDNVPIDGGQSNNTAVLLGKNYIVPGFDKELLGLKKGDEKKFNLPYPKEHYMKNLAGKMVDFQVVIKDVYERALPELNDDFAKTVGAKDFVNLKEMIEENIKLEKEKEVNQKTEKEMLEKIIEKTQFEEIPEMLIDHEAKTMLAELEQSITNQGAKFEDYLSSIGKTRNQLTLDILPEALKRVKASLIIREIAILENIKVEEFEIEENIIQMKKYYGDTKEVEDKINTPEYRNYIANVLNNRKVIEQLMKWNVVEK